MDPPSVEGWHTGKEWIDGGTLTERINFAVNQVKDTAKPGPQEIVARLRDAGRPLPPEEVVDRCLELAGRLELSPESRRALVAFAASGGDLSFEDEAAAQRSTARVGELLTLIVAAPGVPAGLSPGRRDARSAGGAIAGAPGSRARPRHEGESDGSAPHAGQPAPGSRHG